MCTFYRCSVEGVFYRIGQKLEKYRLEPVASTIDDHIANSKVCMCVRVGGPGVCVCVDV